LNINAKARQIFTFPQIRLDAGFGILQDNQFFSFLISVDNLTAIYAF